MLELELLGYNHGMLVKGTILAILGLSNTFATHWGPPYSPSRSYPPGLGEPSEIITVVTLLILPCLMTLPVVSRIIGHSMRVTSYPSLLRRVIANMSLSMNYIWPLWNSHPT